VSAEHEHVFHVLLQQRNVDALAKIVDDISYPSSPLYGRELTTDEIAKLIAPEPQVTKAMEEYFWQQGASHVSLVLTRDVMRVIMNTADINRVFNTSLHQYDHKLDSTRHLYRATRGITVPAEIEQHVDLVKGLSDFPLVRKRSSQVRRESVHSEEFMLKQEQRAIERSATAPGSVQITEVAARGSVHISFVPTCANGQPTRSTNPPCSDQGASVTQVTIYEHSVRDVNYQQQNITVPVPTCSMASGVVMCGITIPASENFVPLWDPVTVGVQLSYEGPVYGAIVFNEWPTVNVPAVTPSTLQQLYSIPSGTRVTNAKTTQCVVEFEQQYYDEADLRGFLTDMGLPSDAPVDVIGPNDQTNPGVEANLDIQYIMGVGVGAPTTYWSIKANSTAEIDDILSWAYAIGNTTNPPLVNSLSYGMSAPQVDKFQGSGYLARSDVEFMKLAARRITIIIASGDTGAGDLGAPPMSEPTCNVLHPDWPSQSPYVLAIGSTTVSPNAEPVCYLNSTVGGFDCDQNPLGEIVASLDQGIFFTTGGGFSTFTARPAYQDVAVSSYLAKAKAAGVLPPDNVWSTNNTRGYNDAVAVGHNLMVKQQGKYIYVDGTSASAPIFAGVLTLLNDLRLNAGKTALGFANPVLYAAASSQPSSFYDVSVGNNRCGAYGWTPVCCEHGWHALAGWDAASGLGSPNYASLADYVLSVQ
jgi:tripeptidyl-peptidase I